MIAVKRYTQADREQWNVFNKNAKNGHFMFDRNFMEYHSDRFTDHSLLFFDDDRLTALLPVSEKEGVLYSHGGLTYGGFLSDTNMKQTTMNACFDALLKYAKENGFTKFVYKCIPYIYHKQPAEEDRYALYANGAKLMCVDASTYVNLDDPLRMQKQRERHIKKALKEGVEVREFTELQDFETFIAMENDVLARRHDTKAVHTGQELKMLRDRFPENIHLIAAVKDGEMIGGTVLFVSDTVVHTQYLGANETGRRIGALDLAVSKVIEQYRGKKHWLDFGISTEHGKIYLNEGLISQKEGFGGRTGVYEIWQIETQ